MNTMPFKQAVAEMARQLENLLFKLGATGSDLYEKASSINHILDEYELRQLHFISNVNNKILHDKNFRIKGEHQKFIDTCLWMIERLEEHLVIYEERRKRALSLAIHNHPSFIERFLPRAIEPKTMVAVTASLGIACLLALSFSCTRTVERTNWPRDVIIVEDAVDWPKVAFWTVASMVAAYQTMRYLNKHH